MAAITPNAEASVTFRVVSNIHTFLTNMYESVRHVMNG